MTAAITPRPDLIQATYRVLSPTLIDPEKKAKSIAWGQTTDTWTPNERSGLKKLEKHRGLVLGVDEKTHVHGRPYEYHLTVGFPPANTEGDIPSLLTMIFGKISMDGKIRVESIQFPDAYLKGKGPRFGIPGIRQKVGEPTSAEATLGKHAKPLAMAIFKPCVGLSPTELGEMFYELACGGMHLVKDDEILPDLDFCPAEKRLEACLVAGERAQRATGQRTLYAVNLTGLPSKMIAKARKLAKQGVQCFLFNVLSYGYGLLEELRDVGVPIMAHPALAGGLCGSPDTGMSYAVVLGSLMRLGGADIVLFPSSYGTVALPHAETLAIKEELTRISPLPSPRQSVSRGPAAWSKTPLDPGLRPAGMTTQYSESLLPSFPAPSAGIHPGLVPKILHDYGHDVIINAGGGVHGHPMGARAGAKAFRQAINWVVKRGNFGGLSQREFPELAEALRLWGKS